MSDRMLVATRKGLFTLIRGRGGRGWTIRDVAFLGDNCSMTLHDPRDGALYAALGHGHFGCKLHRSPDGGKTWEAIGVPTYPEKPADYKPAMNPAMGKTIEWSLELVWELRPGGPDERGRLWCGTLPGGLFSSDDFGATWQLNRPLWDDPRREEWFGGGADFPGIHSVCVDPRDPRMVSVGISCGGVWQTRDSGQSWTLLGKGMRAEYMPPERAMDQNIQDPHLLVQCPGQPEAFWVQHHNGMFRSRDGAQTFTELTDVKPSNFGFAVAVHPRNPDTAWFVPAVKDERRIPASGKVVVNRTRDGGRTFEQLTDGLPQNHAYDLVFRHSMDIDSSGEVLAFGSTTGSLWTTQNGGDSWETVSTHLPPVYCVRFA